MNPDFRGLLITAGLLTAVGLMVAAILEMNAATNRIDASLSQADVAATLVSQLMEEAREITRRAAEGQ